MLCILREVGNKVRRKSHSTFSLLRCCILSVMSPMNPVSQKCVVEKGTNIRPKLLTSHDPPLELSYALLVEKHCSSQCSADVTKPLSFLIMTKDCAGLYLKDYEEYQLHEYFSSINYCPDRNQKLSVSEMASILCNSPLL
ncbi:hypothetical protein T01_5185 [Trichinella spiralis]|uniref:Uncharacterized protein n=1 Tax=Trichinella spiralis TaxID=6334 RepID=A0A0V1BEF3_TRISP|nr:hypothetical protein T01_5185 [Trichinella spiralis]